MRGKKPKLDDDFTSGSSAESDDAALAQRQREASLAAIREGLADVNAGRTYPAAEVLQQLFDSLRPGHPENLCS